MALRGVIPTSLPDRDMAAGEIRFGFLNGVLAVVEDAGGQDGIGLAPGDGVVEVLEGAGAAAGYDGDLHGFRDCPGQLEVVPLLVAVGVHAGEEYLTGAKFDGFAGPFDGVDAGGPAATVGEDLPLGCGV